MALEAWTAPAGDTISHHAARPAPPQHPVGGEGVAAWR
jgi:hypothetical protein